MEGLRNIVTIILIFAVLSNATTTTKEIRTGGLPEKIIGGVIEIVHSHKNKPATAPAQQNFQQTYPNQGFQAQYPQYQQWSSQSNGQYQGQQGQGFNYHGQYQNQGQYGNYQIQNGYNQGSTYPQNTGNYNPGQVYPQTPAGSFSNGQNPTQGQYQVQYPNQQTQPQYGSVQHQNNQQFPQQPSGNYPGQNQGNYQGQKYPSNNLQGQNGSFQGQGNESGQNQGFQVSGGHQASGSGGGPTCVCQAWTKPSEVLNDPTAEKTEKMSDEPAM